MELLEEIFSPRDVKEICNLPPRRNVRDKIVWHGSPNGIYSVKSGYHLATKVLEPNSHHFVEGNWNKIWNTDDPHKVRNFVWRAVRDVLPDRVNLQSRGVNVSCNCIFCDANPENTWHVFVDCPYTKQVWREADLWGLIDDKAGQASNFADLFFSVLASKSTMITEKFLMIMWSIWRQRNVKLWENKSITAHQTVQYALEALGDWRKAKELNSTLNGTTSPTPCVLWHKPPPNFLKCNTDAAILEDMSSVRLAAVFRDDQGNFVVARTSNVEGIPLVKECEALALLEAISWATELGLPKVIFESDAKQVVDAIYASGNDLSEFGDIISRCRILLLQQDSYSVCFARRQANGVAHTLAQKSCFSSCPMIYYDMPSFLASCMNITCPIETH